MAKIYLLLTTLCVFYITPDAVDNYGSYDMLIHDAKSCKGPKRKDCGKTTIVKNGKDSVFCNLMIDQNIPNIKGKVLGSLDHKEIIKINVAKPCQHIFFMPLLKVLVKMTDDCVILKGQYSFTLNMLDMMNKYNGASFLFGNWTYKAIFYNDDCNFTCGIFHFIVTPK